MSTTDRDQALPMGLRERVMAEAYHRRFLRSLVHRRPPAIAGVDSMVGLFINTVPVRVRLPRGAP